jgi:hypothetical protein
MVGGETKLVDEPHRARLRAFLARLLEEAKLGADRETVEGVVEDIVAMEMFPAVGASMNP